LLPPCESDPLSALLTDELDDEAAAVGVLVFVLAFVEVDELELDVLLEAVAEGVAAEVEVDAVESELESEGLDDVGLVAASDAVWLTPAIRPRVASDAAPAVVQPSR
jgi:hypothetical protein